MYDPPHVLSSKSIRQQRNVFIWCTETRQLALGWRVDDGSPTTVSTAYRWITSAVQTKCPVWRQAESFVLCPVVIKTSGVLRYSVHKNGSALSRESNEIISPGDYGVYATEVGSEACRLYYYFFRSALSFSDMESGAEVDGRALLAKASLMPSIMQQALARDQGCIFSGHVPGGDSDPVVVTWIFPPFLGYELSDDPYLENKYYGDPDACDLSEFMVVPNAISGCKDIITLFWENKLGVDVDDNYRIIVFEGSELLNNSNLLKSHLVLADGPNRPSDKFLHLQFRRCLGVSVCRGDVTEDYEEQEIEDFVERVYGGEIDHADPRWSTPLGIEVRSQLIREKRANDVIFEELLAPPPA